MKGISVSRWSAVVALAALPVMAGCSRQAAGGSVATMEFAPVERRDMDIRAEAAGNIEPIKVVEVKSKASGEVLRIHVETGDEVQRGALMVEIEPRDVKTAYDQAVADLEVAKARLATSEAQRARTEELRKARVATDQEYEAAALDEANSRAQLVRAQTTLELARERLNDVTIRAPIAGTLISRTVEEGQIIASASQNVSGGTTLLLMADLSTMQVRALVDETDLGRIQPGQMAQVSVEAYRDRRFEGRVLKIEPQAVVDQNVTMFPVLVLLDNSERLLRPGMNADVIFHVASRTDVVAIPNAAVVNPRDAEAAGAVLGLDSEAVRNSLQSGGQRAAAAPAQDTAAQPAAGEGQPSVAAAQPQGASEDCAALMQRARQGGGFQALGEADRAKLRECRPRGGRSGGPGSGEFNGRGNSANSEIRPAVVFVAKQTGGIEARRVMLGLNDFDYSEVISGLEPGERVVLISVARMQAQQQQFNDAMRQRAQGAFTGQAPTGGRGR